MSKRLAVLIAAAILPALTFAAPAHARTQYPYRLVDPGTFGGPGSFLTLPGSITRNGTVIGTADTITPDPDLPVSHCAPFCDGYVQHAFAWRGGRLTDLGALAPAAHNNSAIYQLNGNGVGTGESENGRIDPLTGSPSAEATVFEHGRVVGLGTLGGHWSGGGDINSHGQVTGFSTTSTRDPFPSEQQYYLPFVDEIRGFVWRGGVMRDLGTLGGPDAFSVFENQRGQIAGWSDTNWRLHAATGAPTIDPFLWQDGRMIDLGGLGGRLGFVNWLNDKGEVVGSSDLPGDHNAQPFLWQQGHRMRELPTIGGGYGFANFISPQGDISGSYFVHHKNFHGFLWRHGHMTDLPPVGGAAWAFGNAVNDRGQVVGNEATASNREIIAALWSGGHGYDLNTLVAPSDFQMISADYINNQGEIFGHGLYTSGPNAGDARVFVLIRNPRVPLPPASTPARPLPVITGPPDRSISVILALHAAHRGSVSVPSARY